MVSNFHLLFIVFLSYPQNYLYYTVPRVIIQFSRWLSQTLHWAHVCRYFTKNYYYYYY